MKVKNVSNGWFEVDPKSGRNSQLLHAFTGRYFEHMNQPILVYEMETPKELTIEEVYEVALEWLREQEVADDYNRNVNRAMGTPNKRRTERCRQQEDSWQPTFRCLGTHPGRGKQFQEVRETLWMPVILPPIFHWEGEQWLKCHWRDLS